MTAHEFGGDWTEQKLRVLDEYLKAYCQIFKRNPAAAHLTTVYVDAFAGGGLIQSTSVRKSELFSEFGETDAARLLQGSASRALRHPFDRYLFIDKSESRVAELEALRAQSGLGDRIAIRRGDANSKLETFAAATDWRKTRAVVFLDPYGMQVN